MDNLASNSKSNKKKVQRTEQHSEDAQPPPPPSSSSILSTSVNSPSMTGTSAITSTICTTSITSVTSNVVTTESTQVHTDSRLTTSIQNPLQVAKKTMPSVKKSKKKSLSSVNPLETGQGSSFRQGTDQVDEPMQNALPLNIEPHEREANIRRESPELDEISDSPELNVISQEDLLEIERARRARQQRIASETSVNHRRNTEDYQRTIDLLQRNQNIEMSQPFATIDAIESAHASTSSTTSAALMLNVPTVMTRASSQTVSSSSVVTTTATTTVVVAHNYFSGGPADNHWANPQIFFEYHRSQLPLVAIVRPVPRPIPDQRYNRNSTTPTTTATTTPVLSQSSSSSSNSNGSDNRAPQRPPVTVPTTMARRIASRFWRLSDYVRGTRRSSNTVPTSTSVSATTSVNIRPPVSGHFRGSRASSNRRSETTTSSRSSAGNRAAPAETRRDPRQNVTTVNRNVSSRPTAGRRSRFTDSMRRLMEATRSARPSRTPQVPHSSDESTSESE